MIRELTPALHPDFLTRSLPGSSDSVLTKLMSDVLPAIVIDPEVDSSGRAKLYLANSGSQRGDVVSLELADEQQSAVLRIIIAT